MRGSSSSGPSQKTSPPPPAAAVHCATSQPQRCVLDKPGARHRHLAAIAADRSAGLTGRVVAEEGVIHAQVGVLSPDRPPSSTQPSVGAQADTRQPRLAAPAADCAAALRRRAVEDQRV
eukprot:1002995-Rhodomonas_salina.1